MNQFTFYLEFNYFNLFREDYNGMPDFQYVYNFQSILISLKNDTGLLRTCFRQGIRHDGRNPCFVLILFDSIISKKI